MVTMLTMMVMRVMLMVMLLLEVVFMEVIRDIEANGCHQPKTTFFSSRYFEKMIMTKKCHLRARVSLSDSYHQTKHALPLIYLFSGKKRC